MMDGWLEASVALMQKVLSSPANIEFWRAMIQPMARDRFESWSQHGEPVSLFQGMSELVLAVLFHMFTGPVFAEKHEKELIPLVRAYESAMQKPLARALPRWASKDGRLLDSVEKRFKELIDEEVTRRLENMDKYKDNIDYLQMVLNNVGGKFYEGIHFVGILTPVYPYHILGLLNGAHTNQTTTFVWSLLHAVRSPLLAALRQQNSPDLLEATFRETGRLYTNLINLRRITTSQFILGKYIPEGTFVACSPVITSRDSSLFNEADKFRPERWLTPSHKLDDVQLKNAQRTASSIQFGKGQHACVAEKLGRTMVLDAWWAAILGDESHPGYDVEIISGVREGVGIDNVGVEAAWAQENLGTPFEKGDPVMVKFRRRI
jgi:cytochrome P450